MTRLIVSGVGAVDFTQALEQRIGDPRDVVRVLLDMRIAGGVHIALAAIETGRHIEPRDEIAGFKITGLAGRNLWIGGLLQQDRQPADFEFHAGAYQQIGVAGSGDQARPGFDPMRILQRVGGTRHFHFVAADLGGQCGPFRFACEDVEGGKGRVGGERERRAEKE